MSLSIEVLKNIAFAEKMGFTTMHQESPAVSRKRFDAMPMPANTTPVGQVINKSISVGDGQEIPIRIYVPAGTGFYPTLSFFHGGGFVFMSLDSHDELCRQLCVNTGTVVMSVGYRLAPEFPYPVGPNDCLKATKWFIENAGIFQGDGANMATMGDSSGGYMALHVAQDLRNEGVSLRAQIGVYPVTDHYTAKHESWTENRDGYVLSAEMMQWFWDHFVGDEKYFEGASLLRCSDFTNLPPSMIITCKYDPLRDEGQAYVEKLVAAGVSTVHESYDNVHGFFGSGDMGREAMDRVCAFLVKNLFTRST